jgi:hypothetical protein
MKIVRTAPPNPTWQDIKKFDQPPPAPAPIFVKPVSSNALAEEAVRISGSKGGIDGRMMHPVKKIQS